MAKKVRVAKKSKEAKKAKNTKQAKKPKPAIKAKEAREAKKGQRGQKAQRGQKKPIQISYSTKKPLITLNFGLFEPIPYQTSRPRPLGLLNTDLGKITFVKNTNSKFYYSF